MISLVGHPAGHDAPGIQRLTGGVLIAKAGSTIQLTAAWIPGPTATIPVR